MIRKTGSEINTVIFDMDGVIIETAHLWERAEKKVFSSVGVKLTNELCKLTAKMTTSEVTKFWFEKQPWKSKSLKEVENGVIEHVAFLIKKEGKAVAGICEFIGNLKSKGYKIGLATNAPAVLIPVVLEKLELGNFFDAVSSSEYEPGVKPNPSVYLTVAAKLNSKPENCIAVEDSFSGLLAAKKAGMKTIAYVKNKISDIENGIADYIISSYAEPDFSLFN